MMSICFIENIAAEVQPSLRALADVRTHVCVPFSPRIYGRLAVNRFSRPLVDLVLVCPTGNVTEVRGRK